MLSCLEKELLKVFKFNADHIYPKVQLISKNMQACELAKCVSLISKPTQAESAWFHVVGILWKRDDAVLRVSDERDASGGQMSVLAFKLYRTTVFWETWTDLREVLGQRVVVLPGLLLLVFRTCFFCVFNFFLWTFLLWWGFRPLYIHCLFDFCDGHQCFVTILLCCLSIQLHSIFHYFCSHLTVIKQICILRKPTMLRALNVDQTWDK